MLKTLKKVAKKRKMALVVIAIFLTLIGGFSIYEIRQKGKYRAEVAPPSRLVRLHNLHNWNPPRKIDADYNQKVELLARRDNVIMGEDYVKRSELNPQILRSLNPNVKVYPIYTLIAKVNWDSDAYFGNWSAGCKNDDSSLATPISCQDIFNNDWWLRDGNGDIIIDASQQGNTRFLDPGKPGYKETFLKNLLNRMSGKGYDGIVFDYWYPELDWLLASFTPDLPRPAAYPTDDDWFNNAWKPFIEYVMTGLHNAGYKIIANCGGEYIDASGSQPWQQRFAFQRSQVGGVIYEQGAVDWWNSVTNPSGWLLGRTIEKRINSLLDDPLEVWQAESGISDSASAGDTATRDRKQKLSLAMYYTGLPLSEELRQKRSYGSVIAREISWEPLWDFDIGAPATASPEKMADKYFWSRKFSKGIVLLNYESQSINFTLDQMYKDIDDNQYAGTITLEEHSGMILQIPTRAVQSPSTSPGPPSPSAKISPSVQSPTSPSPTPTPTPASPENTVLPSAPGAPGLSLTPTPTPPVPTATAPTPQESQKIALPLSPIPTTQQTGPGLYEKESPNLTPIVKALRPQSIAAIVLAFSSLVFLVLMFVKNRLERKRSKEKQE